MRRKDALGGSSSAQSEGQVLHTTSFSSPIVTLGSKSNVLLRPETRSREIETVGGVDDTIVSAGFDKIEGANDLGSIAGADNGWRLDTCAEDEASTTPCGGVPNETAGDWTCTVGWDVALELGSIVAFKLI